MRTLAVQMYMTIDGVMEAPETWSFEYWTDHHQRYAFERLSAADALLLGRRGRRLGGDAGLPARSAGRHLTCRGPRSRRVAAIHDPRIPRPGAASTRPAARRGQIRHGGGFRSATRNSRCRAMTGLPIPPPGAAVVVRGADCETLANDAVALQLLADSSATGGPEQPARDALRRGGRREAAPPRPVQ